MGVRLLGINVDKNGNRIGFKIIRMADMATADVPEAGMLTALKAASEKGEEAIQGIGLSKGKLVGTEGSLDRYSKYVEGKKCIKEAYIIISRVSDDNGSSGFRVMSPKGIIVNIKDTELFSKKDTMELANAKWVTKEGNTFISSLAGSFNEIQIGAPKEFKENRYRVSFLRQKVYPCSKADSKLDMMDENTGMTVMDKMTYANLVIKDLRPYYYSALCMMEKLEVSPANYSQLQTMGVAMHKLYFNPYFVKEMRLSDLIFVMLHEILHVAMCHESRKQDRDHRIFNEACDFYINKMLQVELDLPKDFSPRKIEIQSQAGGRRVIEVSLPKSVLYNDTVNLDEDTPESIYKEIFEDNKKNSQGQGQGNGQGQGQEDGQSQGAGQGSGDKNEEGNGSGDASGSGSGDGSEGSDSGSKSKTNGQGSNGQGQVSSGGTTRKFRDTQYTVAREDEDMVADDESSSMTQTQKKAAQRAQMRRVEQTYKQQGSRQAGNGEGGLERYVREQLAPIVDWKKIMRNVMLKCSEKTNSFSSPDRRFLSRGKTLPGPRKIEGNELENIIICIDTSGSIGDEDLGMFMNQIMQLLKQYKVRAELVYWDTEVRASYEFSDVKELLKCRPHGGGGTSPECVFEYLDTNKDYKIGLKKQPALIVFFTDGYFYSEAEMMRYKGKYGKKTLFIVNKSMNNNFKAPFGTVAPFKDDREA